MIFVEGLYGSSFLVPSSNDYYLLLALKDRGY